jgi:predicted GH43/DUF377 family glycosyl hydrolase
MIQNIMPLVKRVVFSGKNHILNNQAPKDIKCLTLLILLVLNLLGSFIMPANATTEPLGETGKEWTKYSNNPLNLDAGIGSFSIMYDRNVYRIWYSGPDGKCIKYATSSDGITWAIYGTVLSPGPDSWDKLSAIAPTVVYNGSVYLMWYRGYPYHGGPQAYGLATSPDGISWTKYSKNPVLSPSTSGWDSKQIGGATVLLDGSTYKMWYHATSDGLGNDIGYATSTDGISWEKYAGNPVIRRGKTSNWDSSWDVGIGGSAVIKDAAVFKLWYSGIDRSGGKGRIGYTSSMDGISWKETTPVLNPDAGQWDGFYLANPAVMKIGNEYRIWYVGNNGQWSNSKIGLASAQPETPVVADIVVSYPTIVDNLKVFESKTFPEIIDDGRFMDISVSVQVSPSELVQKVQIEISGAYPNLLEMSKMESDTYYCTVVANDPDQLKSLIIDLLLKYLDVPGTLMPFPPTIWTQPKISAIIVTDIYGQVHRKSYDIELPTAQNPLPEVMKSYKSSSSIGVVMICPVDLLITDPQNRGIGAIYEDGILKGAVNEIPGAYFLGEYGSDAPKIFLLPNSVGLFKIRGFAFGSGFYNLTVYTSGLGQFPESVANVSGSVELHDTLECSFEVSPAGSVALSGITRSQSAASLWTIMLPMLIAISIIATGISVGVAVNRRRGRSRKSLKLAEQIRKIEELHKLGEVSDDVYFRVKKELTEELEKKKG